MGCWHSPPLISPLATTLHRPPSPPSAARFPASVLVIHSAASRLDIAVSSLPTLPSHRSAPKPSLRHSQPARARSRPLAPRHALPLSRQARRALALRPLPHILYLLPPPPRRAPHGLGVGIGRAGVAHRPPAAVEHVCDGRGICCGGESPHTRILGRGRREG